MKKKVFISYRYTGENAAELKKTIQVIYDAFEAAGHGYYSTMFDNEQFESEKWSGKMIMEKCFKEIDSSDIVLFFVKSPDIS